MLCSYHTHPCGSPQSKCIWCSLSRIGNASRCLPDMLHRLIHRQPNPLHRPCRCYQHLRHTQAYRCNPSTNCSLLATWSARDTGCICAPFRTQYTLFHYRVFCNNQLRTYTVQCQYCLCQSNTNSKDKVDTQCHQPPCMCLEDILHNGNPPPKSQSHQEGVC